MPASDFSPAAAYNKKTITLPHKWSPRWYQIPLFEAWDNGMKRAALCWPRRAGKDTACVNLTIREAFKRVGNYGYMFPNMKQGRKAVWESINKAGVKFLDQAAPMALRDKTRDADMFIRFKNGSKFQIVGSDNYDTLVGSNLAGIVFSEYSLTDPLAWQYLSPMLAENEGWMIANGTPRGRNAFYKLMNDAAADPLWYCQRLTVDDTKHMSREALEAERRGMPHERFLQEYYTSFEAALMGAIFGKWIEKLHANGGITDVPYDPRYPVETAWDIGVRDSTVVWFFQRMPNGAIHVIDYAEDRGKGLPFFAGVIHSKGYSYAGHIGPHDLEQPDWTANGATRRSVAMNYGLHFSIAPKAPLADGIEAVRARLPMMKFDAVRCARGILALEQYRYDYDEEDDSNGAKPVHDWTSHAADALRYFCTSPPAVGILPNWALNPGIQQPGTNIFGIRPGQFKEQYPGMMGHSGGPSWAQSTDGQDFDPLAFMRSQQR